MDQCSKDLVSLLKKKNFHFMCALFIFDDCCCDDEMNPDVIVLPLFLRFLLSNASQQLTSSSWNPHGTRASTELDDASFSRVCTKRRQFLIDANCFCFHEAISCINDFVFALF